MQNLTNIFHKNARSKPRFRYVLGRFCYGEFAKCTQKRERIILQDFTSSGEEVDLLLKRKGRVLAFEFKASTSPKLSKGIHNTLAALKADHCFVVSPVSKS